MRLRGRWTALIFGAAALAAFAPGARAIVGPSTEHGPLEPYVAMVLARGAGGSGFCSAVVIARDVLLTAAHCARRAAATAVHFREPDGRAVLRPVAAIAIHPEYRANAIRTRQRSIDLAMIRLTEPLPARFAIATLATSSDIAVGERFRVAGFGLSREGVGASGGTFRTGEIAAVEPLSSVLLWAEDPAHRGAGACSGDSGGPVFDASGTRVVAITDWTTGRDGAHCGALTQAALIAPQRGWIDATLRLWAAR